MGLTFYDCKDLPQGLMSSGMKCTLWWMTSIRLNNLMLLPDEQRLKMSFSQFVYKFVWFLQPISATKNTDSISGSEKTLASVDKVSSKKEVLWEVVRDLGMAGVKVILCQWVRDWIVHCTSGIEGGGASLRNGGVLKNYSAIVQLSALFGFFVFVGLAVDDVNNALVTLFTWGKYKRLSFSDWPILSESPREFWGRRYNRVIGTMFRESVFQPLRLQAGFSPATAAMATFAVSAAQHMHVAKVCFGDGVVGSTMAFFLIHGIACGFESRYSRAWSSLPRPFRIALTQGFLLVTTPLYPALFIYASPAWFINNPVNITLPSSLKFLPIPDYCPIIHH